MARRYVEAGLSCVIDDAVFPEWPNADLEGWKRDLGDLQLIFVVLLPSLESTLKRNREREGTRLLTNTLINVIYEMMSPWQNVPGTTIIDNSRMTVAQTVAAIDQALAD